MCRIYITSLNTLVLLFLLLKINSTFGLKMKSPAPEFKQHTIVRPRVHDARTKREIPTTKRAEGLHHSEVTMSMNIDDEEYVMDLKLNEDLIPEGHVISYQENGEMVTHTPKKEELDICQYSGVVRDKPNSWAAVSTCQGVRGVIHDGLRMRHIEPAESEEINSNHYVYNHADLTGIYKCGVDAGFNKNNGYKSLTGEHQLPMISSAVKKADDIRTTRYIELVLVVDRGTYRSLGSKTAVYKEMKDLVNIVNSLYSPLNIVIALVGVEIWTDRDKISLYRNSSLTLTEFTKYQSSHLKIHKDNVHLITSKKFDADVLGLGYVGSICYDEYSTGVITRGTSVIGLVASVLTHEMGHNLGMRHDDDIPNCRCPAGEYCIMNRFASEEQGVWSSCSKQSLIDTYANKNDHCLRNKPRSLFDPPTSCGKPGEQCDCSIVADSSERQACHSCCDPDTCMLRRHATCASGECCDLPTCRQMSPDCKKKPERFDKPRGYNKPERFDKPRGSDKPERFDKPRGFDKPERFDKPRDSDKPKRFDKPRGSDKPERFDKPRGSDKPERFDKPRGSDKPERFDKPRGSDIPERFDKPRGSDEPGRFDKPRGSDEPERFDKPRGSDKPEDFVKPDDNAGPDSDSSNHSKYIIAIYVVFLGVLPLLLLIFIIYCCQNKSTTSPTKQNHASFFNKFPNIKIDTITRDFTHTIRRRSVITADSIKSASHKINQTVDNSNNHRKITKQDIVFKVPNNIDQSTTTSSGNSKTQINNNASDPIRSVPNAPKRLKPVLTKPMLDHSGESKIYNHELGLNKNETRKIPFTKVDSKPSPQINAIQNVIFPKGKKPKMATDLESILAERKTKIEESLRQNK